MRRAHAVLAGAALLSGCVLPLPEYSDGKTPFITSGSVEKLSIGKASRTEVVMLLGAPSARRHEDRVLEYNWDVIVGFWGLGLGAVADITRVHRLCLEFDDHGVLTQRHLRTPGILGSNAPPCSSIAADAQGK